ncbi:MAG: hypothetical protein IPP78_13530 [Holophagaceae bacterium]|nr:hypothetical protein [Holophagaceae bacterium]
MMIAGEWMEGDMEVVKVPVGHQTQRRLEALALLQNEVLPGLPYTEQDAVVQALERGLDHMLHELLVRTGRRGN